MLAEQAEYYPKLAEQTHIPVAAGERMFSRFEFKRVLEAGGIAILQPDLSHAGGITGMRRIADFASLYQVRTGSHGPSDLSPVCHAAALHFDLWVPNFGVQEYMGYSEQMLEVFPHSWRFDNGYMHPGDKPGLGIEFDEKAGGEIPVRSCLSSGCPSRRWHIVELVIAVRLIIF